MSQPDMNERLLNAVRFSNEDDLGELISNGADVNAKGPPNGWTPLQVAAFYGNVKCVNALVAVGADLESKDSTGYTPLHWACWAFNEYGDRDGDVKYFETVIALIRHGADVSVKTEYDESAFDKLSFFKRRRVERELEKYSIHQKLMSTGSRPVDVVKIFLCGDPSAGKSTLKKTLTKKLSIASRLGGLFAGRGKEEEDGEEYWKTPGIDVETKSVKGAGRFVIWDCAGQIEYSVTHGMFLGSAQSVFVVLYNVLEWMSGKMSVTKFWLPFVKAAGGSEEKPKVVLVATHADGLSRSEKSAGLDEARKLLTRAKEMFSKYLDIDNELILVDARDEQSESMGKLRDVLKRRREEIIGSQTLPKLCDEVLKKIKKWREELKEVPVIAWDDFFSRVKDSYMGIDEDTLREVTAYLHNMGHIYLAKFDVKGDLVVINTQWFTTNVIGKLFAGTAFATQQVVLRDQPYYTLSELRGFFTEKIEATQLLGLLDRMDLVHETEDGRYLIPAKLPSNPDQVSWDPRDAYAVKGVSIKCAEVIDIFNPCVFPSVQKQMLDQKPQATVVSRQAVKRSIQGVTIVVKLSKMKSAVNVAVRCSNKTFLREAHASLRDAVELIESELNLKSAGTNLTKGFISHADLCEQTDLEDVFSYTEEELVRGETQEGHVRKNAASDPEDVSDILFQGYDSNILRHLGSACRYEWLPVDALERIFERLDVINDWREDYRSLAKLLSIADHVVELIAKESESQQQSVSRNLIKRWCKKNEKKMTIGTLRLLLSRMGLEENTDCLTAIDEVLQKYPGKEFQDPSSSGSTEHREVEESDDFGISDHLVRWRRVLKRKKDIILTDMDPCDLTSTLLHHLPSPMCKVLENTKSTNVKERMSNVKTLVVFLLESEKEDWPTDLLTGLRTTHQSPLAQTLQEEYLKVTEEDEAMKARMKDSRRGMPWMGFEREILAGPSAAAAAAGATSTEAAAVAAAATSETARLPQPSALTTEAATAPVSAATVAEARAAVLPAEALPPAEAEASRPSPVEAAAVTVAAPPPPAAVEAAAVYPPPPSAAAELALPPSAAAEAQSPSPPEAAAEPLAAPPPAESALPPSAAAAVPAEAAPPSPAEAEAEALPAPAEAEAPTTSASSSS